MCFLATDKQIEKRLLAGFYSDRGVSHRLNLIDLSLSLYLKTEMEFWIRVTKLSGQVSRWAVLFVWFITASLSVSQLIFDFMFYYCSVAGIGVLKETLWAIYRVNKR